MWLLCRSWCWTPRRCACRACLRAPKGFPETPRVSSRCACVPAGSSSCPRPRSRPPAARTRSARETEPLISHLLSFPGGVLSFFLETSLNAYHFCLNSAETIWHSELCRVVFVFFFYFTIMFLHTQSWLGNEELVTAYILCNILLWCNK